MKVTNVKVNPLLKEVARYVTPTPKTTTKKDTFHVESSSSSTQINTTYSKTRTTSKNYGELFGSYLEELGAFESMDYEQIEEVKKAIQDNVYQFDKTQKVDEFASLFKITDSVYYLRSLGNMLTDSKAKADFYATIDAYRKDMVNQINTYIDEQVALGVDEARKEQFNLLKQKIAETNMLKDMVENSNSQIEGMKEAFETMSKCLQIAMSIMDGDNVPQKDIQFLMENNPDLFKMAMSVRKMKEDPEDKDSVLEDEEDKANESGKPESEPLSIKDFVSDDVINEMSGISESEG